jgi:hypothetical protein
LEAFIRDPFSRDVKSILRYRHKQMIGKLLKTLSYRVKTEEADWRSENTVIREMSYNFLQGTVVYIAKHPLGWPLSLLTFLSAVSAALCFAQVTSEDVGSGFKYLEQHAK